MLWIASKKISYHWSWTYRTRAGPSGLWSKAWVRTLSPRQACRPIVVQYLIPLEGRNRFKQIWRWRYHRHHLSALLLEQQEWNFNGSGVINLSIDAEARLIQSIHYIKTQSMELPSSLRRCPKHSPILRETGKVSSSLRCTASPAARNMLDVLSSTYRPSTASDFFCVSHITFNGSRHLALELCYSSKCTLGEQDGRIFHNMFVANRPN